MSGPMDDHGTDRSVRDLAGPRVVAADRFTERVMTAIATLPPPTPTRAFLAALRRRAAREALAALAVAWHLGTVREWTVAPRVRARSLALVVVATFVMATGSLAATAAVRVVAVPGDPATDLAPHDRPNGPESSPAGVDEAGPVSEEPPDGKDEAKPAPDDPARPATRHQDDAKPVVREDDSDGADRGSGDDERSEDDDRSDGDEDAASGEHRGANGGDSDGEDDGDAGDDGSGDGGSDGGTSDDGGADD